MCKEALVETTAKRRRRRESTDRESAARLSDRVRASPYIKGHLKQR